MTKKTAQQLLENFNIDNLDIFEEMLYNDYTKHSSKVEALQLLINSVEGDYSQLSEDLAKIAELQDAEMGIIN